ncbi:probable calcium-binding protein CML45 [Lycium barbarum]|uniref:probable calcium-binding protein CML45 n=1 Tax=Lycium barbarum TaxID=112863 RepID=UPI00293ECC4F|nr:probable calcium-binding protein CML45 [Lycium barbarum]
MEKIFSFSAQAKKIGDALNHFNSTILICMIFCLVITFQEFRSCFSFLIRVILLVFTPRNKSNNAETSPKAKNFGPEKIVNNEKLLDEDVEIVLDALMNICKQNGDKNIDKVELAKVFDSFGEKEPSLEEVKEAFDMFDENGDGHIDATELKKVICKMGFMEFSVLDCQRMIAPFDENRDGKIEFGEFVKLMENICQ